MEITRLEAFKFVGYRLRLSYADHSDFGETVAVIWDKLKENCHKIQHRTDRYIYCVLEDRDLKNEVIQEEDSADTSAKSGDDANIPPTPPPRPRSRCLSDCSLTTDSKSSHYEHQLASNLRTEEGGSIAPPPLPPKQYKGSRRPYKPLPAEPDEANYIQDEDLDSSDKNTDSESIKQEINALTSKIARMAAYHK